jgi:hypothetical protein
MKSVQYKQLTKALQDAIKELHSENNYFESCLEERSRVQRLSIHLENILRKDHLYSD